jgi:hypothetical protein
MRTMYTSVCLSPTSESLNKNYDYSLHQPNNQVRCMACDESEGLEGQNIGRLTDHHHPVRGTRCDPKILWTRHYESMHNVLTNETINTSLDSTALSSKSFFYCYFVSKSIISINKQSSEWDFTSYSSSSVDLQFVEVCVACRCKDQS